MSAMRLPLKLRVGFYLAARSLAFLFEKWRWVLAVFVLNSAITFVLKLYFEKVGMSNGQPSLPNELLIHLLGLLRGLVLALSLVLFHRLFIYNSWQTDVKTKANLLLSTAIYFLFISGFPTVLATLSGPFRRLIYTMVQYTPSTGTATIWGNSWVKDLVLKFSDFLGNFSLAFANILVAFLVCGIALMSQVDFKAVSRFVKKHWQVIAMTSFGWALIASVLSIINQQLFLIATNDRLVLFANEFSSLTSLFQTLLLVVIMSDFYVLIVEGRVRPVARTSTTAASLLEKISR